MNCDLHYIYIQVGHIYTSAFSIRITFYSTCSQLFINHNFIWFENYSKVFKFE